MLPPTPAATIAFKSPNACNLCHTDRDAAWADRFVREWRPRDYQAPVLERARLIDAARRDDWSKLPDMLAYLARPDRDEVFANSLVRLLRNCDDDRKWPALVEALKDASPLIRASAADGLIGHFTPEAIAALLAATRDDYRLVRMRAAASLAGLPAQTLTPADRASLEKATADFVRVMMARPDDHASHYNLGNYYMSRREYKRAIECFETASRLQPDSIPPLVNVSLAYNAVGQNDRAEESLRKALRLDPANAAANLNLGLLLAEMDRLGEAETVLRAAFKSDPRSAVSAYNLGVILAKDRPDEAIDWCRRAHELRPLEPKYAYTYAFYLRAKGELNRAIETLEPLVRQGSSFADAYSLLGQLYEEIGRNTSAIDTYRRALAIPDLDPRERYQFEARMLALSGE